jgi:hypothetical protein
MTKLEVRIPIENRLPPLSSVFIRVHQWFSLRVSDFIGHSIVIRASGFELGAND